jgi:phospholipid/cholesterol/gamma-HCH transport system substrate-binding protein
MMPQLDSTLKTLNHSLSQERIDAIVADAQASLANVKKITASLNQSVPATMDKVNHIATNFSAVSDELKAVQWDSTLQNIEKVVANLENVSNQLKSNENTLGALLNDKQLYQNLDSTVQSATALLIDLKENPKRYVHFSVFGSKDKKEKETGK